MVILIISILSVIGLGQYQNLIARSQFSESLAIFSGAKTPVQERIDQGVAFEESTGAPGTSTNVLGINLQGNFGTLTAPAFDNSEDEYTLTFTFDGNVNTNLRDKTINVIYDRTTGQWDCITEVAERFTVSCTSL